jgi:hypothetical protein
MRNIQITDETVNSIFKDLLVEDYMLLLRDIHQFEDKITNNESEIKPFEHEDAANWLKTVAAIDILLDYYFTFDKANEIRIRGKTA